MDDGCIDLTRLSDLVAAGADDPRWEHVRGCARCRAHVAAYRSFLRGRPELSDEGAEALLAARLAREIRGDRTVSAMDASRRERSRWFSLPRATLAIAAALVLIAGIVFFRPERPRSPLVLRSGSAVTSPEIQLLPAQPLDSGGYRLRWHRWPGATSYEVHLYGADLLETAVLSASADTSLSIAATSGAGASGPATLWRVTAHEASGVVARSALAILPR